MRLMLVLPTIKLDKINPNNKRRCLYLWYRQSLLTAIRDYKKQLGMHQEVVKENGKTKLEAPVEYDDERSSEHNTDFTGEVFAKLELWSLFDEEEAFAVELYVSGYKFTDLPKTRTLYRRFNSAKEKIIAHYAEHGITMEI